MRQLNSIFYTHQYLLIQLNYLTILLTNDFNKQLCRVYIHTVFKIKFAAPPVVVQELPLAFYLPLHYAGFDNELSVS